MKLKEIKARIMLDSRGEETIEVFVNGSHTSAPSGKSLGKHERPAYKKNLWNDAEIINKLNLEEFPEIKTFEELEIVEKKLSGKIGANSLFALEASILKALARFNNTNLWKFLNPSARIFPRIISNTIGGGAHSKTKSKKTDFQEFLVCCNKNPTIARVVNADAHEEAGVILKSLMEKPVQKNDENAWQSELDNETTLETMKEVEEDVFDETGTHLDIGLDCAASQFYKNGRYVYKNLKKSLSKKQQIKYIIQLAKKYDLFYIEDPLDEEDFKGFAEIKKKTRCLIVGDDLTVTNLARVEKAIKLRAVNGVIIKPNQTGSLLEVKRVIDLCKKNGIRTIMSHRSGETLDDTIADLSFAWQCDFIKIPVVGKEREAKVDRLIEIENRRK